MLSVLYLSCVTATRAREQPTPQVEDFLPPEPHTTEPRPESPPADVAGTTESQSGSAEESEAPKAEDRNEQQLEQATPVPAEAHDVQDDPTPPAGSKKNGGAKIFSYPEATLPALPKVRRSPLKSEEEKALEQPLPGQDANRVVNEILGSMSLEEKVGQLFILGLEEPETKRLIVEAGDIPMEVVTGIKPGGFILMGGNLRTVEQTLALIQGVQSLSRIPLFIAVDQEGGPVSRLSDSGMIPATRIPSSASIGLAGDPELAYLVGRIIGRELLSLGININFAPVADVNTNRDNPAIGIRSYGSDPAEVSLFVAEVVAGMQDENVSAVIKHFPGHGDTRIDTHHDIATIYHDLERLRQVEFRPFEAGIEADADGVMTAHIIIPNIAEESTPATFSSYLLQDILREELGYKKLIITDALEMKAVTRHWSSGEAAVAALAAGADMLLKPADEKEAYSAVLSAVHEGRISVGRIDESVRRILSVKFEKGVLAAYVPGTQDGNTRPDPYAVLGCPEHQAVVDRINELARKKRESKE